MKKNLTSSVIWVLAIMMLWSLLPVHSQADRTLRCSSRLVSIGDFKEQVEDKCGAPDHMYQWEYGHDTAISEIYDYERERYIAPRLTFGPIHMERWTYNFGSTRLIHYLYFKNGKLIKIETGETGSN